MKLFSAFFTFQWVSHPDVVETQTRFQIAPANWTSCFGTFGAYTSNLAHRENWKISCLIGKLSEAQPLNLVSSIPLSAFAFLTTAHIAFISWSEITLIEYNSIQLLVNKKLWSTCVLSNAFSGTCFPFLHIPWGKNYKFELIELEIIYWTVCKARLLV